MGDESKLKKKDLDKIEQSIPADLFSALHADTGDLKKTGWSQPLEVFGVLFQTARCFCSDPTCRKI
ncbi:MAG: hypothetical protein LUO89_14900 [Methanothrix sp.]|nr:hypothetical protein [Methanothrix sp.]